MSIHYRINLPDNFPKELIDMSKSLKNIGVLELAWNKENSIKVIDFLNKNNYLILGGDVYKTIDGELNSTYDSWYFNKDKSKSSQELLHESRNRAIEYINKYHEMNGQDYYYSIVFILSK
ncbi:Imm40 family immunity protein [Clostridium baratii]|uniref:Imm40 family immunity protein n=1 Tax=Clostridium baratii TaxID=1561 RepID=UPI00097FB401|nr:Imm40 family immunity protein [Clostridium baratii]AQM59813.1 hypothetical protein NPD11_870 [Clostridium baratii]